MSLFSIRGPIYCVSYRLVTHRDKVDQADYMEMITKKFGIFYLEDPMDEDDFGGFASVLAVTSKNRAKT